MNVAGFEDVTVRDYLEAIATVLGRPFEYLEVRSPEGLEDVLYSLERPFGGADVTLDRSRLLETGFRPTAGAWEGLMATVAWHVAQRFALRGLPGYVLEKVAPVAAKNTVHQRDDYEVPAGEV